MTDKQLKKHFGRDALAMVGAMFQHQSKIGEQARFLNEKDRITVITQSGRKAILRRSQVHPSVVCSALKSTIATSAAGISNLDVFIQGAGGTPEGIVAAIMVGFQRIIYVGNGAEDVTRMSLPSLAVERSSGVNYMDYSSPDPEVPEKGVLAVEAVKMLVPSIKAFVTDDVSTWMVQPPFEIVVPPLQTLTFIGATKRVLARTIAGQTVAGAGEAVEEAKPAVPAKKRKSAEISGPGSDNGAEEPELPKSLKNKKVVTTPVPDDQEEEDNDEDEQEGQDDDEDEEDENEDDDMKALKKMQSAAAAGKKKQRKSTKPKNKAKGKK
jgi:hypothetical protein